MAFEKMKSYMMQFKRKDKKKISVREKAIKGLAAFFVVIICFTILSRAADSMTVAEVSTETASKKNIIHDVSANGTLTANQEQAISVLTNQKIKGISVNVGQKVEVGDLLFELDLEYLNNSIQELEAEIEKLRLRIGDLKSGKSTEDYTSAQEKKRASEDYNQTADKESQAVSRAYEAMIKAQQELESFESAEEEGTDATQQYLEETDSQKEKELEQALSDQEKLEKEITTKIESEKQKQFMDKNEALTEKELEKIEAAVRKEYKDKVQAAKEKVTQAQQSKEESKNALDQYLVSKQSQNQQSAEETKQQLYDDFQTKKQEYEMTVQTQNESLTQAKRGVEDANKPKAQDSSVTLEEMELANKEKDLLKLKELTKDGGKITASTEGVITNVSITVGSVTQDGVAMLMSDQTKGYKVVVPIQKDQQKYVSVGDKVTMTTSDNKKTDSLTIDWLTPNEEDPEVMNATIFLEHTSVPLNSNVTIDVQQESNNYDNCVSINSVHADGNQYYLLVVKESDSVMGKELTAERVNITIVQKNGSYAAVADGELMPDQKIITGANKTIQPGDRIRLADN